MATPSPTSFQFGDRTLDPDTRELTVHGCVRETEPKVFDLIDIATDRDAYCVGSPIRSRRRSATCCT